MVFFRCYREAIGMALQQYGCLNKANIMIIPVNMLKKEGVNFTRPQAYIKNYWKLMATERGKNTLEGQTP